MTSAMWIDSSGCGNASIQLADLAMKQSYFWQTAIKKNKVLLVIWTTKITPPTKSTSWLTHGSFSHC